MKEKFLLNFTQYEREIADFPKATKSQEIGCHKQHFKS